MIRLFFSKHKTVLPDALIQVIAPCTFASSRNAKILFFRKDSTLIITKKSDGKAPLYIDVKKDHAFFLPPDYSVRIRGKSKSEENTSLADLLVISGVDLPNMLEVFSLSNPLCTDDRTIFDSINILLENKDNKDLLFKETCKIFLVFSCTDPSYPMPFKEALSFIDDNYRDVITLSQLSNLSGLSESWFCDCFQKNMQMRPVEYINKVRISYACIYLSETNLSVCEIAKKTGFENQAYFSTVFSKLMGISPVKYRSTHRQ